MKRGVALAALLASFAACTATPHARPSESPRTSGIPAPTLTQQVPPPGTPAFAYVSDSGLVVFRDGHTKSYPSPSTDEGIYHISASPNGLWIAVVDRKGLRVAPSYDPSVFKVIAPTRGKAAITGFVWGDSSQRVAYVITSDINAEAATNSLYTIRPDGSDRRFVRRVTGSILPRVVLKRYSEHQRKVLWFYTGEGGYLLNPTSVDVSTGRLRSLGLRQVSLMDNGVVFSTDLNTLYYVAPQPQGTSLRSEDLRTGRYRILYSLKKGGIDRLLVHPSGNGLLFSQGTDAERGIDSVWSLDLRNGKALRVLFDANHPNVVPTSLSPSGRYAFMDFLCMGCGHEGEYYLFDLKTKALTLFYYKSDKDFITFVGWVV